jgi:hypothetical protein
MLKRAHTGVLFRVLIEEAGKNLEGIPVQEVVIRVQEKELVFRLSVGFVQKPRKRVRGISVRGLSIVNCSILGQPVL